jgi:Skp family chaperone for outer membrane proteins
LSQAVEVAIIRPPSDPGCPSIVVAAIGRRRGSRVRNNQQGVHSVNRQIASIVCAAVVSLTHAVAFAQAPVAIPQGQPQQVRPASPSSHVAVIDVGYIFKNHIRFKAAMDKMKDEVMAAENALKGERDRINGLMEQLKGFNVGTPEYKKLEAEIAKGQGDFNVNAQLAKKDFMDREAKVYLQVYTEVEKAVAQFAREHGIAVVFRFDGDPVDGADRNQILRGITKPIVFYEGGNDITPDVLKMLNGTAVADQTARPGAAVPPRR